MGLDVAELMIAFEEEFDVDISEAEAQRIETVGDLVNVLESLVSKFPSNLEEAQQLRDEGLQKAEESLCSVLNVEESALTEQTKLDELFPLENRNELWKEIQRQYPDRIPSLQGKGCLCFLTLAGLKSPTEFPFNCNTVTGLARRIMSPRICLDRNGNLWTQETIEKAVKNILVEYTGTRPEKINRSTHFYELF